MSDMVTVTELWEKQPDGSVKFTLHIPGVPDRVVLYKKGECPIVILDPEILSVREEKKIHKSQLE